MVAASSGVGGLSTIVILVALIAFVLFRRLWRNKNGVRYSHASVFLLPIIYIALTAFFIIGLSLPGGLAVVATIIMGIAAGLFLGKRSEIFEKDGKVMYRRSVEVMAIWIVGFVIRIVLDFVTNPVLNGTISTTNSSIVSIFTSSAYTAYEASPLILAADLLLAFSAGLLLGEAIVLYRKHKEKYRKQ